MTLSAMCKKKTSNMLQNSEINIAQQNIDLTLMQVFNASTVKFMERNNMTGSIELPGAY